MDIEIVRESISRGRIKEIAQATHGDMAKAVVDVERRVMAMGGEMHADAEAVLLDDGSRQEHLWGINLYPEQSSGDFIEFVSLINIRPGQGNRDMEITDAALRDRISTLIQSLVTA